MASTDQRDASKSIDEKGQGQLPSSAGRVKRSRDKKTPVPLPSGRGFDHSEILDRDPFEGQGPFDSPVQPPIQEVLPGEKPFAFDDTVPPEPSTEAEPKDPLAKTLRLPETEIRALARKARARAEAQSTPPAEPPSARASAIEWPSPAKRSEDTVMTAPPKREASKSKAPGPISSGQPETPEEASVSGDASAAGGETQARMDPLSGQKDPAPDGADDTTAKPSASKIEQGDRVDNTALDSPEATTKIEARDSTASADSSRSPQRTVDSRSLTQPVQSEEHELAPSSDSERKDRSGEVLGERYELVKRIGIGGMGTVYKAIHRTILRSCAVKVLDGPYMRHPDFISRLTREAQAASVLRHPNIVDVSDFGRTEDGSVFLVMEYLEGEDLSHTLAREQRLSWPRTRHIVLQILQALEIAHAHGIVHRDIKLENCFRLTRNNDDDFIKVLDFGNAKEIDPPLETDEQTFVGEARRARTAMGTIVGTAAYLSPEHAQQQKVDQRSDLYALGIVLFELLTGQLPFEDESFVRVLTHHIHTPVPSIKKTNSEAEVTPEIEALILKLLEKDPEDRFQDASSTIEAMLKIPADAFEQLAHSSALAETSHDAASLEPESVKTPIPEGGRLGLDSAGSADSADSADKPSSSSPLPTGPLESSAAMSQTWDDSNFGARMPRPRKAPSPRAGVGDKLGVPIRLEDEQVETEVMGMEVGLSSGHITDEFEDEFELEQLETQRRRRQAGVLTGVVAMLGLLAWGLPTLLASGPTDDEGKGREVAPSSTVSVGSKKSPAYPPKSAAPPTSAPAQAPTRIEDNPDPLELDEARAELKPYGQAKDDAWEAPAVGAVGAIPGPSGRAAEIRNKRPNRARTREERLAAKRERRKQIRERRAKNKRAKRMERDPAAGLPAAGLPAATTNPVAKDNGAQDETTAAPKKAPTARFSPKAIGALKQCAKEHGRIPGDKFPFIVDTNAKGIAISIRVIIRRASAGLIPCLTRAVRGSNLGVPEAKRHRVTWRYRGD